MKDFSGNFCFIPDKASGADLLSKANMQSGPGHSGQAPPAHCANRQIPVQWANCLNIRYFVSGFRVAENAGIYREISMIVRCAYFLIPHVCGKADSLSEQVTFRFIMIENGYRQNKDPKPGPSLC